MKVTKSRSILVVLGLLLSTFSLIAPASALPTVTASGGGNYTFKNGVAITPITFSTGNLANGQTLTGFTAVTALPAEFSLNATTGTITGTPSVNQSDTNYTIRATFANPTETVDTVITFEVIAGLNPQSQSFTFTAGTAITATPAIAAGGFTGAVTYSVTSGTLPSGLTLNTANGSVSGTPQIAQSATTITITGTGANAGTDTTTMTITINAAITPATQTITGVAGTAITASTPFSTAGFTGLITYAVTAGTLPTGLSINSSTGVISGTPTGASAQANYTITATDSLSRTATAIVTITISAAAITPATQTLVATAGNAITATTAFTAAGFTGAITYSVLPALPAGLTLNATTGVITGTPTGNQAATIHTITALGASSGTATATITITVSPRITPATQTLSVVAGSAITATAAFAATGFTGTVIYSVNPALPAGLTLNTNTGVITGTPTVAQAATTYTITATGTTAGSVVGSGVTTATIAITIGSSITPLTSAINLTLGVAMTPTPTYTLTGFSGVITYSIAPALPAGLILNTATGVISGTPAVLVAPSNYVITATGAAAGLATATVTLAVYAPLAAPAGVSATAGNATATITWQPVVGATSYQVVSIPAGGVCAVTGTQAVCSSLVNNTAYTFRVTAVNQAGPAALSATTSSVTPKPPFITKSGRLVITYSITGTVVPAASLTRLRTIGAQFKTDKGTNAVIAVRGFTSKASTALERRLALSRATLVTQALRAAGLSGSYTTTGDGVTNRTGAQARKVVVKYSYQVPTN